MEDFIEKTVTIRGRNMLCISLIEVLDNYRIVTGARCDRHTHDLYCSMIVPLQTALDDYCHGKESIDIGNAYIRSNFERYHMPVPENAHLPEALELMIDSIDKKIYIDINDLLDCSVEYSKRLKSRIEEEREAERRHIAETMECLPYDVDIDTMKSLDKIVMLVEMLNAKRDKHIEVGKDELSAVTVWCMILVQQSIYPEGVITYDIMHRLVDNGHMTEGEVQDLLMASGYEHDFEWYDEDFMGSGPDSDTYLKISDVIQICEGRLKEKIGYYSAPRHS